MRRVCTSCTGVVGGLSVILTVCVFGLLECYDACRLLVKGILCESVVKRNCTGFVLEYKRHNCYCGSAQRLVIRVCIASTGSQLDDVKEKQYSSLFPFCIFKVANFVFFVTVIARTSMEDQSLRDVLAKQWPCALQNGTFVSASLNAHSSHIHHSDCPSTVS